MGIFQLVLPTLITQVIRFLGWFVCIPAWWYALPSGKHAKRYGKLPFLVDLPIENCDFPYSYVSLPEGTKSCHFHRVFFGQHWIAIPQELGKWWQSPEKLGYIRIPSGYVKITIENGPNRNSWFTELKDCDFPVRYVKLPEDNSHIHSPSFQWGRTSTPSTGAPLVKHHFSINMSISCRLSLPQKNTATK